MLLDEGVVADRQDGEHTVYGYDGVAAADGLATMVTVKASAVVGRKPVPSRDKRFVPSRDKTPVPKRDNQKPRRTVRSRAHAQQDPPAVRPLAAPVPQELNRDAAVGNEPRREGRSTP
ncbi:hypothetical protein ACFQV4_01340 [Streptomyces thermocarboxydus]